MSKLTDKLERMARGNPVPLGFGALARTDKLPPMLMIGVVAPDRRKQPVTESVDAVLFDGVKDAGDAAKKLGDAVWGVALADATKEATASARTAGADFMVVSAAETTVEALEGDETTYLLSVQADLSDRQLRALDGLPVEGFVLRQTQLHQPVTLEDLMSVSTVRMMTGKLLFVEVSPDLGAKELEALRDMEIAGLLVDLAEASPDALRTLRERLLNLPKPRDGRKGKVAAVLPQQGISFGRRRPPEPEEPDEEEEDE